MLNFLLSRPAQISLGVLFVVVLVSVFILVCILNHRTPVPKGCEHLKPEEGTCKGCQIAPTCPIRAVPEKKEEKSEKKIQNEKENQNHE